MALAGKFTKFLAYLDTLHDFCGARNRLIPVSTMKSYVASAFNYEGVNDVIKDIGSILSKSPDLKAQLHKQINELFEYRSGNFNTFEQNVVDFVMTLSRITQGDQENVVEFNIKKNEANEQLKTIIPKHVVYDTSVLSYNYICNTLDEQISVTMATMWDGDGANVNIPESCSDDQTRLSFHLTKTDNELSSFDKIAIEGNTISTVLGSKKATLSWQEIQDTLGKALNVKSYVTYINKPAILKDMLLRLLQMKDSNDTKHLVGRITDVKRSGDWLQLAAMQIMRQSKIHPDMMLYTVDTPLAARALATGETAVVTYSPPGKGVVNIRVVGNAELTPKMRQQKQEELQRYEHVLRESWLHKRKNISSLLDKLSDLIVNLVSTQWISKKTLAEEMAEQLPVADMRGLTFPVTNFLRQKHIQILTFLLYVYVMLRHLNDHKKKYAVPLPNEKKAATTATRKRGLEDQQPETTEMDDQSLLKTIRNMKTYFIDGLGIPYIEMIYVLKYDVLEKDLAALKEYVKVIPDVYKPTLSDDIDAADRRYLNERTSITNQVHYMMSEMIEMSGLIDRKGEDARNPKYRVGQNETNYSMYANAIKNIRGDAQHFTRLISRTDSKSTIFDAFGKKANELKNTVKTIRMQGGMNDMFDTSVATGRYFDIMYLCKKYIDNSLFTHELQNIPTLPPKPVVQISPDTQTMRVPTALLAEESPFIQQFFAGYPFELDMVMIPVVDYLLAILLRDMFISKNVEYGIDAPSTDRRSPPPDDQPAQLSSDLKADIEKLTAVSSTPTRGTQMTKQSLVPGVSSRPGYIPKAGRQTNAPAKAPTMVHSTRIGIFGGAVDKNIDI